MRRLIGTVAAVAAVGAAAPAWAHAGAAAATSPAGPWVLGTLALATIAYAAGFRRLRRRSGARVATPAVLGALLLLGGCDEGDGLPQVAGLGDPEQGAREIERVGCGTCHIIPGIDGARGLVGPPLDHMGRRVYIAGLLPNRPANMVMWLRDPQEIVPGNAMPDLGLSEQEARDIAAYLETLR